MLHGAPNLHTPTGINKGQVFYEKKNVAPYYPPVCENDLLAAVTSVVSHFNHFNFPFQSIILIANNISGLSKLKNPEKERKTPRIFTVQTIAEKNPSHH